MSCSRNAYTPYSGSGSGCCHPAPSCCTTLCPCGPTGPTGPSGFPATNAFTVGFTGTAAIPTTAGFYVPFNIFTANSSSSYLLGTGAYQAPHTGLYIVSPTVGFASEETAPTAAVTMSVVQNGVARLQASTFTGGGAGSLNISFSTVLQLFAGDVVQIQCQANISGFSLLSGTFPTFATSLSIVPLA